MGIAGMVAKSPTAVYERLAYRRDDIGAANELAALSLIRPSATCGHLGDVVGDKLIYDAPTAHGGSGGPVFNSRGEVIGVNSAFLDGFSGGTLGISSDALRPLLVVAKEARHSRQSYRTYEGGGAEDRGTVAVRAALTSYLSEPFPVFGSIPARAHALLPGGAGARP